MGIWSKSIKSWSWLGEHVYLQIPGNRIEGWPFKVEKLNLEKNNSKAELLQKAKKKGICYTRGNTNWKYK